MPLDILMKTICCLIFLPQWNVTMTFLPKCQTQEILFCSYFLSWDLCFSWIRAEPLIVWDAQCENAAGIKDDRWFINTLGRLAVFWCDTNQCFCLYKHGHVERHTTPLAWRWNWERGENWHFIHQNMVKYFKSSLSL